MKIAFVKISKFIGVDLNLGIFVDKHTVPN